RPALPVDPYRGRRHAPAGRYPDGHPALHRLQAALLPGPPRGAWQGVTGGPTPEPHAACVRLRRAFLSDPGTEKALDVSSSPPQTQPWPPALPPTGCTPGEVEPCCTYTGPSSPP